MNTQRFFIISLVIVVVLVVGYKAYNRPVVTTDTVSAPTQVSPKGKPVFTWEYSYDEKGEFPKTHLSLVATYENDVVIEQAIDTPDGSCNVYETKDSDVYADSEMLICYAAGLGNYYKIVSVNDTYLVQRKTFEEASPEYNPPIQSYQTIAQF